MHILLHLLPAKHNPRCKHNESTWHYMCQTLPGLNGQSRDPTDLPNQIQPAPSAPTHNRYGSQDTRFGQYMAQVSALTYSEKQDVDVHDVATARSSSSDYRIWSHCMGTCQAGICTTTPLDAYCCFSDLHKPEEAYESHTGSYRSRRHDEHMDKYDHEYMDRHDHDREYEDRYRERPHKDRLYHCWRRNMS